MIELINGECLEEMDKLIERGVVVGAIITDPPYGTTACKWDSVIPFDAMWERLNKLIKPNGAVVLFGSEPFSSALRMSNIKNYKYDWVWDKKKAGNIFLAKYQPMKAFENILIFSNLKHNYFPIMEKRDKVKKSRNYGTGESIGGNGKKESVVYTYTHKYPKAILEISNANQKGKVHPTQKPVALMEYLIKTYTNENETVLDFTMGSGTTGVACVNTGRNFIGIELDSGYFKVAQDRIYNNKGGNT
jgi:site-specific DNA-methyltransferase (adenine-specific)